jgi:hypothetical protein
MDGELKHICASNYALAQNGKLQQRSSDDTTHPQIAIWACISVRFVQNSRELQTYCTTKADNSSQYKKLLMPT